MKTEPAVNGEPHPSLRDRLIGHIIQTVPDDIALCEFNCSATECSQEAWSQCSRRLLAQTDGRDEGAGSSHVSPA